MAEQVFTVPLSNVPQKFSITLGGRKLDIISKWNEHSGWVLDLSDGITSEPIVFDIPLVAGCDLLSQYEYLSIPGSLIIYTDGEQFTPPNESNLGKESNLYYVVDV